MSSPRHFHVLRVVLPAATGWSELSWFGFEPGQRWAAQGQAALTNLPSHDELEIILPAKRVAAHKLTLPANAGKHLPSLIGQALEDRLLGDKTDVLSIPGPQIGAERLIWVCRRSWLESELARLGAAGWVPDRLFPDYDLLPEASESTPYAQTADGYLFRTAAGSVGLVSSPSTISLLPGTGDTHLVPDLYRLPIAAAYHNGFSVPLARFKQKAFDPRCLRRVALLLAASGGLLLLGSAIHWRQLENRETRLQHEIRQTFAMTFPGTPIIDPVLQWESKRREQASSSTGDALDAVLELAARLNVPLRPRRLEARDNVVRLTLTDTEVAQFRAQLESAGNPESTQADSGLTRLQFSASR
jgi:type II secretory pathway component PulL